MITAIITAYKPAADFTERFLPMLASCDVVVVVDNTPGGHAFGNLPKEFVLVQDGHNTGLAAALNVGVEQARRLGATKAIFFDQDSTPSASLVRELDVALSKAMCIAGPCCGVGPAHLDDRHLGQDVQTQGLGGNTSAQPVLTPVTCLPTSGLMFNLEHWRTDNKFSEDLFLDLVDFDWCWRLRSRGWSFWRATNVVMLHRLGTSERRFLGITFYVPAPYRHYFLVRDTLRLAFRSDVPLYSQVRLISVLPFKALVYPFILDRGWERLRWMYRGMIDYFRGVRGIGAAGQTLSQ